MATALPVFPLSQKHSLFEVLECDLSTSQPLGKRSGQVIQGVDDEGVPLVAVGGGSLGLLGGQLLPVLFRQGGRGVAVFYVVRSPGCGQWASRIATAKKTKNLNHGSIVYSIPI